jgi:hypothetical protein
MDSPKRERQTYSVFLSWPSRLPLPKRTTQRNVGLIKKRPIPPTAARSLGLPTAGNRGRLAMDGHWWNKVTKSRKMGVLSPDYPKEGEFQWNTFYP